MTGYGEASFRNDALHLTIELRAVNNRYLKTTLRTTEPYYHLEPEFEKVIRQTIRRGTIQIHVRCSKKQSAQDLPLNTEVLCGYIDRLRQSYAGMNLSEGEKGAILSQVLALPGVVPENVESSETDGDWPLFEKVLRQALQKLQAMRVEEGRAMAEDLLGLRAEIGTQLEKIRGRMGQVSRGYRDRLLERVRTLVAELDVQLDSSDLIKEVSVYAERADISEEVARLASHLDQFQELIAEPESSGRKLEFLTQEMFRETNTIGSKASDVEISRYVVDIKAALEKIREQAQNIE